MPLLREKLADGRRVQLMQQDSGAKIVPEALRSTTGVTLAWLGRTGAEGDKHESIRGLVEWEKVRVILRAPHLN